MAFAFRNLRSVINVWQQVCGVNMRPKAIEVQNLHKNFSEIRAVDGVSFNVEQGEIFSLLGHYLAIVTMILCQFIILIVFGQLT